MTIVSTIKGDQLITSSLAVGHPTGFVFDIQGKEVIDLSGSLIIRHSGSVPLSPIDAGIIFYDKALQKLRASQNGGAAVDLIGAGDSGLSSSQGVNLGLGQFLYKGNSDLGTLQFRSIRAGTGVSLVSGSDDIIINVTVSGSTGSSGLTSSSGINLGVGQGLFAGNSDLATLKFRTLLPGFGMAFVSSSETVMISYTGSIGAVGENKGPQVGQNIFDGNSDSTTLRFRRLLAGTGVALLSGSDTVMISVTGSFGLTSSAGVNSGSGQGIYKGNSDASTLQFRSLQAGRSVSFTSGSEFIRINAVPQLYNVEMGVSSTTVITTGEKGRKVIPISGTLESWSLVASPASTLSVALWKANNSIPTIANVITGLTPPTLTGSFIQTGSFAGWSTTAVAANDIVIMEVLSNDLATYILLSLTIRLT